MFLTRKIGKILRGNSTPFQLIIACVLGTMLGFVPGFSQAPGLLIALTFALIVINANLVLAALVGVVAKMVALPLVPLAYSMGTFLLDGPAQGLFKTFVNAPVLAFFGIEYYTVTGGQFLGLILGLVIGVLLSFAMTSFRKKMADLEKSSEMFQTYSSKFWVRALVWIILGGGDSKESWDDFLAKKIGNPIRLLGIVFIVLLGSLLYILSMFLKGPILSATLQSGLERINGATVEIKDAEVDFKANRLTVTGLVVADSTNLEYDLIRAEKLEADIDTSDLLRKRVRLDKVHLVDATHGEKRAYQAVQVGPPPKLSDPLPPVEPDDKTIDEYVVDSSEWKEKLAKLKEWIEQASGIKDKVGDQIAQRPDGAKEEKAALRRPDYFYDRALHLLEESPSFTVGELFAEEIHVPFLETETLNIRCKNLSSHPHLVKEDKEVSISSSKGTLGMSLFLGGPSGGDDRYEIAFFYKDLPVEEVLSGIKMGGVPPLQGGTIDISTDGNWKSQEGEMYVHLPVTVLVKGTTVAIPKLGQTQLDSLILPVNIQGPLDNPRIKVDTQAFSNFLLEAGKSVLQKKITSEIQKQIGGNLPANLLNKRLQGLIPSGAVEKPLDTKGVGGLLQGLLPLPYEKLKTMDDRTDQKEKEAKPEDAAKSLFKNLLNSP
jgi:uncharacterized protein (TIGR03546 family)